MSFHKHVSVKEGTPQTEQALGRKDQVLNNAGGYVFKIDQFHALNRFLVLGTEGGTYYQSERRLTHENATMLVNVIKQDGKRVVDRIVHVSDSGRAPKNNYALFALAASTVFGDDATRHYAFASLPKVARIPTHLFQFVEYREALGGGWGRAMRRAVAKWYGDKEINDLIYHVLKYQQRQGWSNRDLLRLTKPKVDNPLRNQVYGWIVGKNEGAFDPRITAVKQLHSGTASVKEAVKAITDHKLTHEMLPTELLTKPEIWDAMLQSGMPFHAMLRNLGNMSKCDLLKPMSKAAKLVVERIEQADMRKLRVHPIQILMANRIYGGGRGARGRGEWVPVPQVVDALDDAFYRAFDAVEPTGQKWLIGLDVSGSMSMDFSNYPGLMVSEAAAAMAMVIARTEPQYYIHGFAQSFVPLNISAKSTLTQALNETSNHTFGSTDCALPMVHAKKRKLDVDVFCVITDNETWAGTVHPFQALRQYRQYIKHDAKLIVVGMTATQFSIADPSDPGMLDVVGFDAAVPTIMADFAKGQL